MRDLPPRSTEFVRVAPTDEQAALHGANLRIVSSIVRKPYINEMDLLRLRKALLMCRMSADSTYLVDKQEPGYSSKLAALDDLLGALLAEDDRKIVLFSEWTTMLGLIEPLIGVRGAEYVRLDGSVPQKQRQPLVQRFQNDAACRAFVTTNAGATGLNLQAANTVVNVDLPWNPAVLEQRIARAHRMGQKSPVQVYVLVTEGTIEESLLATLSAKHELALAALDVESDVDAVDLASGTSELKNRLEVLLGAQPDARVDESEKARETAEAERHARREKVALAAGELLGAAFAFVDELIPARPGTPAVPRALAEAVRQQLGACMEGGDDGRLKLTVTLPDAAALDRLAGSLARLLAIAPGAEQRVCN
jgi:superfamily II DNA/RNA helicase